MSSIEHPSPPLGASAQRIVDSAARSRGQSWRLSPHGLYLQDNGEGWFQFDIGRENGQLEGIRGTNEQLARQLLLIMDAVRARSAEGGA
jgi:hypothetical protein